MSWQSRHVHALGNLRQVRLTVAVAVRQGAYRELDWNVDFAVAQVTVRSVDEGVHWDVRRAALERVER